MTFIITTKIRIYEKSLSFSITLFPAKVIDEDKLKEKDVRSTLEKMDPNKYVNVEEITTKINDIAEHSKSTMEDIKKKSDHIIEAVKSNMSVLSKTNSPGDVPKDDYDADSNWLFDSDVTNPFYDGFT